MFRRAEQWDLERGGRFDKRETAVLIRSGNAVAAEQGEPVGGSHVRWRDPDEGSATVRKVEWDAAAPGGEAEVRRALELLAGKPIGNP